jgi:hypothetical protein
MHFGSGYVSFVGERFKIGDPALDSNSIIGSTVNTPYNNKGCFITPMCQIKTEDQNSLGTLSNIVFNCVNSEYPPNDSYENLLNWTKENLDPEYYSILKSTKMYSPLIPYRRATNYPKYTELLGEKWAQNYILLDDAMCAFNPQYGQGMTHARLLSENPEKLKDISHIFNSQSSKISEECWLLSTSNDWKIPTLKLTKTDRNGQTETYYQGENSILPEDTYQARSSLIILFFQCLYLLVSSICIKIWPIIKRFS